MVGWLIRLALFSLVAVLLTAGVLSFTGRQIPGSLFTAEELHSPGNWVQEEQIKVYKDMVVLDIPNAQWAGFTNTNSMDPLLDEDAHAIELKPASPDAIQIGDVISYHGSYGIIVHRVIEKGTDEEGIYYLVKGDNTTVRDPFKVRFEQVEGVVIAVIY